MSQIWKIRPHHDWAILRNADLLINPFGFIRSKINVINKLFFPLYIFIYLALQSMPRPLSRAGTLGVVFSAATFSGFYCYRTSSFPFGPRSLLSTMTKPGDHHHGNGFRKYISIYSHSMSTFLFYNSFTMHNCIFNRRQSLGIGSC